MGGYGATGSAAARLLSKWFDNEILIGGRQLDRATATAAELGKASAARLDVTAPRALDDFCAQCSIIINCAGPVSLLQDSVAQAALRSRCHYVDVAGLSFVRQRMLPHAAEIADLGLSFVVSAGWMPGITEIVPLYANSQARTRMEKIESLSVYFGDSGEWSPNALRDAVWYLRQNGLRRPGYFSKGEWKRATLAEASCKADLGPPVGSGRFSLVVDLPEQEEIGRQLVDCDVFSYSYLSGFRTVATAVLIATLPLPETLGLRLARGIFRRNRLPVDGFAAAQVCGYSKGRRYLFSTQVVYRDRRDYWINALTAAMVARMIARGESVKPGVHFLGDAVDPMSFMSELKTSGVEQSEGFKEGEWSA